MAWDAAPMRGQYRYYDGLVHYLSMLHLCGSFKIWKPAQKTTAVNLVSLEVESEAWYTLDGKRLSAEPTQRGIYIRNGKKIYVK
jgi:oligosaccharide reducing-end xylanase